MDSNLKARAQKIKLVIFDVDGVMTDGSLCAMGGLTPMPVMSAMINFPEDFENRVGGTK